MNYTFQEPERRELCHQRDKEFLALYNPTLDALLEQGMSPSKARRTAAEFTRQGMSVENAIDHVLEHCRASRFFITPATALTKICPTLRTRTYRLQTI